MNLTLAKAWVIWSFEHDGWWRPNERGYCTNILGAGIYTEARAREIEQDANLLFRNVEAIKLSDIFESEGGPDTVANLLTADQ
jgi:hypothetical protein